MGEIWNPKIVVSAEWAKALIERQFPALKPVNVTPLGVGFDNTVYEVNGQFVFRFPRRQIAVELLEAEKAALPLVAPHSPIPVPEPVMVGEPDGEFPWMFIGYSKVKGEVPRLLSDQDKSRSIQSLAAFLKHVHGTSVDVAMERGVPRDYLERVSIKKRKPMLQENVQKAVDRGVWIPNQKLNQFLETVREDIPYKHVQRLVHGDLHIRNVLVDECGKLSGIIDWGDTHIGHPAVDLSFVYSFIPPHYRDQFFKEYGSVSAQDQTLARFVSLYISFVLLLYGQDQRDEKVVQVSIDAIGNALGDL